jgi:hypothetical protein
MPDRLIKDSQYWRVRAAEIIKQSDTLDEESRQMMLAIAASYERLAERADRRAQREAHYPPCRRCGNRMALSGVAPATPGYETRSFQCPGCGYAFDELVKIPLPEP